MRKSTSPAQGLRRLPFGSLLLALVAVLQVVVVLWGHDSNFLSPAGLPVREAGLPAEMDPALGRVVTVGDRLPFEDAHRLLTHAYGTFFEVPSVGGYDPLVSWASLDFAQRMDVPNFYDWPLTPELRAGFQDRAVRYWIVPADSPQNTLIANMPGMKFLGVGLLMAKVQPLWARKPPIHEASNILAYVSRGDRAIYEDMDAKPLAFEETTTPTALPVRYEGNSMVIQLSGAAGTVGVSVGPADDWWYRVDQSGWKQSGYSDYRLQIPVVVGSRELEVRYFDPRLRRGAGISLIIMCMLALSYFWPAGLRPSLG